MINISGGPLAYNYPIHSVAFHFGLNDDGGSEHLIDGRRFPGEVRSTYCTVVGRFDTDPTNQASKPASA